jgi:hypothetical protein
VYLIRQLVPRTTSSGIMCTVHELPTVHLSSSTVHLSVTSCCCSPLLLKEHCSCCAAQKPLSPGCPDGCLAARCHVSSAVDGCCCCQLARLCQLAQHPEPELPAAACTGLHWLSIWSLLLLLLLPARLWLGIQGLQSWQQPALAQHPERAAAAAS